MNRPLIDIQFYETYYFASVVKNILHDRFAYIRKLNDFYGDSRHLDYTAPFPKYSAFHCFLNFIISDTITESTEECDIEKRKKTEEDYKNIPPALEDLKPHILPIEDALSHHEISHDSFVTWLAQNKITFQSCSQDDVDSYLEELREDGTIEALVEQAVQETFYILFSNRSLLLLFNEMMADQISNTILEEFDSQEVANFSKDGVLQRAHIPKWVKRAVYYRDRGICCACRSDLTGLTNIFAEEHYDHIVALVNGGLNDITNIQLLCGRCNRKKKNSNAFTSSTYENWYDLND